MDKRTDIEQDNISSNVEGNRIKVFSAEIGEIVHDEAILDIIKKIKASYPFTFIEKSNIQKLINKLDGFFWLKEISGKYILTNEKFARSIGVRISQLENKFEIEFIPPFQRNMFNIMNAYIIDTCNSVILEGISTSVFTNLSQDEQIIQFPLLDVDNKVVAIVGVSTRKSETAAPAGNGEFHISSFLEHFKEPVLIADPHGKVIDFTGGFAEILNVNSSDKGKTIDELFDTKFLTRFRDFVEKIEETEDHPLTIETGNKKFNTSLNFKKVFDNNGVLQAVQITFPPIINQSQTEIKSTMYDLIMQTSPDAIFIYDIDNLKFLEVNDAAVKMYGYKKNELLNMDLTDLYAPEDIQTLIESSDSKNLSGAFTGPWRHKKKDGSSILVEISKASLEYKGKRAHINIVRDVTEKVENAKKIQFLQAAFESSSDLILFTDNDGFITFVNDEVTKSLGYSKKDLEKRPFLSLAVDSDRAKVNKEIFHAGLKNPISLPLSIKNHSNEQVAATVYAKPILNFDGTIDSFILVVKTEEEKLPVQGAKPEQTIDASFLSNVFHEILTPINVILGFTQELFESISSPNSEQKEVSEIIKENQKVLLQIMDNAVEYTSLEQKVVQIKPESVRFTDIIEELKNGVKKSADDKEIELAYGKISSSLTFETDQQRFITLLTLLVKFAVQLTKEKSLFLSAYAYEDDTFVVSLRDQRSSVSPMLLKGLQEVFTDDENIVRKHFGFSRFTVRLAQKLVALLAGRIEVIKKSGQPVEYAIIFPIKLEMKEIQAQEEAVAEEVKMMPEEEEVEKVNYDIEIEEKVPEKVKPAEKEPAAKKKPEAPKTEEKGKFDMSSLSCLYLEDQVDSQILFKSQTKDMKKTDFAESFEKALPLLKNNKYDFIVMDINLQGEYNGLDALRIIQKMPAYEKTPIIACTAYLLPGAKENFVAAGFKDFISKPVMRDKLTEVLKRIFA
jgi:PAS domain S-box-containing protein